MITKVTEVTKGMVILTNTKKKLMLLWATLLKFVPYRWINSANSIVNYHYTQGLHLLYCRMSKCEFY